MSEREALGREADGRLAAWLSEVDRGEAWTTVSGAAELPAQAAAESRYWCDEIFAPGMGPHDADAPKRAVRRGAMDLIRHDYRAGGLDLTVIEGRNFVLVRVDPRSLDLLALPEDARAVAAAQAAQKLFRAPLRFRLCTPLDEGTMFCSAGDVDPLALGAWHQRAEGGVQRGGLWLACYKKPAQRLGFANAAQWFDDALTPRSPRAARRSR